MKHIRAANWVVENATASNDGFTLHGADKGYSTFKAAFSSPQDIWYAASDEYGNREAGHAHFNGSRIKDRTPMSTFRNGVYTGAGPQPTAFQGGVTVACTFNSEAFNLMWESLQVLDPDGDGNINIPPELIDGLIESLRGKADQVDLDAEVQARIAGDRNLQDQIDGLEGSIGNSKTSWDELLDKPQSIYDLGYRNEINGGSY